MDTFDRNRLIQDHLPLAKSVALSLRRCASQLPYADLLASAHCGLVEAAHRYSPATGKSFGAFSKARIRGAVLDGIRKALVPKRRDPNHPAHKASATGTTSTAAGPNRSQVWPLLQARREQIAGWLNASPPIQLRQIMRLLDKSGVTVGYTTLRRFAKIELGWRPTTTDSSAGPKPEAYPRFYVLDEERRLSLKGSTSDPECDGPGKRGECLGWTSVYTDSLLPDYPEAPIDHLRLRTAVLTAIARLPPIERTVIIRHYFHDHDIGQISADMRRNRFALSQIHRRSLDTLRAQIGPLLRAHLTERAQ